MGIQTKVAHVVRLCDITASARSGHVVLGFAEREVQRNRNEKEIPMRYFVRMALAVGLGELSSRI